MAVDPILTKVRPYAWVTSVRVYKSDIYQTKQEDITPARLMHVNVTYNEDFATKRQAEVEVIHPDAMRSMEDFVLIEATQTDIDGRTEIFNLGHYLVMGRDSDITNAKLTGVLQLRDLTWLLQQMTMDEQVVTPVGVDPGDAVRDFLIRLGIPTRLINVSPAGTLTTTEIVSVPGDNWLSYLTDVLGAGGMLQLWLSADNRITSVKEFDVSKRPCTGNLRMSEGARIVPPVRNDPDLTRLRNRVTVRRVTPGEDTISYTATVTNPRSGAHPDELARRMGARRPIILGKTYDEPGITTEAEARKLAENRLSRTVSYLDRLHLDTPLDRTLCGHRTIQTDVEFDGRRLFSGNWLQRVWTVRSQGARVGIQRELTRTVGWK